VAEAEKGPRDHPREDGHEGFRRASEKVNEPNDGVDQASTGNSSEKHWMGIFFENSNQADHDLGGEKIEVSPSSPFPQLTQSPHIMKMTITRSPIQSESRGRSGGG